MPRDSNGVYSLPAGYLANVGETIIPSQHNPPLEDIASALTGSMPRNGSAPMTGPLKLTNGTAAAPAQSFATDATTGLIKTTNGLGVVVAGAQVAEFTAGGLASGSRFIGELFFYSGRSAPALCVFPFGQTLLRSVYPALWAMAQIEISVGNLFFNNGNGTTTFGIGNMAGRTMAARDDLSGSAANVLTASTITPAANRTGAVGGTELHTLTAAQIAAHTHPNTLTDNGHTHGWGPAGFQANTAGTGASGTTAQYGTTTAQTGSNVGTPMSINNFANTGGGGAHPNVQPTMIFNVAMFAGA